MTLKNEITEKIKKALEDILPEDQIKDNSSLIEVTHPENEQFGDYSTNIAMKLAKELKKNPIIIAEEIKDKIKIDKIIKKIDVIKPGFINFYLTEDILLKELEKAANNKIEYPKIGKYKTVVVEFSSPNIAKPFTIGHLRSTIIGNAVANILEKTGHNVKRDNHLGDWGTQFGKQIYAIKTWGKEEELEKSKRPVKLLVDLYVKFHKEAEKNPNIEEEGRKWFNKLENGDKEAKRLWKKCIDWSWKEFDIIYKKLGVKFTENDGRGFGESYFEDKMDSIIKELEEKNLLRLSKGAKLVFFPDDKYPPMMVVKQDGATLYATRDLATDKFRIKKYGKDVKIINEVGAEQSLYFKQLFETEKMLGWIQNKQRVHIKHGMYRFKDNKMSTRKGNVIWLEDVLTEAVERAKSKCCKDNTCLATLSTELNTAEKIGTGALIWNDLKKNSELDVTFNWNEILNMQGNSGPYLQYTYVRTKSILDKLPATKNSIVNTNYSLITNYYSILRALYQYPETIELAAKTLSPHYITTYLFSIAQKFNNFYQKYPIIKAEPEAQKLRVAITQATSNIIADGLNLLGIKTVDKM